MISGSRSRDIGRWHERSGVLHGDVRRLEAGKRRVFHAVHRAAAGRQADSASEENADDKIRTFVLPL
jgi:hypothetical protein